MGLLNKFNEWMEAADGKHRKADAKANSGAVDPADSADAGAATLYALSEPNAWLNAVAPGDTLSFAASDPGSGTSNSVVWYTGYDTFLLGSPHSPLDIKSLEYTGIECGEILAWRCWDVADGELHSMAAGDVWAPGEPMKGDPRKHGVHAWKELSAAMEYAKNYFDEDGRVVIGRVKLWGEVIEYELGYCAEFGLPASLEYEYRGSEFGPCTDETLRALYVQPAQQNSTGGDQPRAAA